MLVRCLDRCGADDPAAGFKLYEAQRFERTARVQRESNLNLWLRYPMDPSWVLSYDPVHDSAGRAAARCAQRRGVNGDRHDDPGKSISRLQPGRARPGVRAGGVGAQHRGRCAS
ncbi:MAG: hypothetical protein WDO24_06940 [Pseudomonadota bacterium]